MKNKTKKRDLFGMSPAVHRLCNKSFFNFKPSARACFINIAINSMTAKLYIFKGKVGMRAFAFFLLFFFAGELLFKGGFIFG